MGIPIRRGRGFDPNDGPTAPPVAIINETMARTLFANMAPLGQQGDPALLAETMRAEIRRIDKNMPLNDMRTMSTLRAEAMSTRRFILLIGAAFGVLALGLAGIGVSGVMSLIVSDRTREVGVRPALGAESSQLLTMVVGQATRLAAIRVTIGVVAALALAPLLDSQLYGLASIDPMTFISVPATLLLIAALTAAVPARKAMCIDPLAALRIE